MSDMDIMNGINYCDPQGCKLRFERGRLLQGHFATDEPDHDAMQEFASKFGNVDIEMRFVNFDSGMHFPLQAARTAAANGSVLFIKIEPFAGKRRPLDEFDYLGEINKGTFDDLFIAMGKEIREFGLPVMLTFGHEMNIEYEGNGTYPWAGPHAAGNGKYIKAYTRVHDLISDPQAGGANNVTWVLNFDSRDWQHIDQYTPAPEKFDLVAVDGYVNDNSLPRNRGNAGQVMHNLFDLIFTAIGGSSKMQDKPLFIGEFGVNSKGIGMNERRKADLLTSFFDYLADFNEKNDDKMAGYIYFDVRKEKSIMGGDVGAWKIASEPASQAYKASVSKYHDYFTAPLSFIQAGGSEPVIFVTPAVPLPASLIDLSASPPCQQKTADWDTLVSLPPQSAIGKYNFRAGAALLDRWALEKYVEREKKDQSKNGEALLMSGIEALQQVDPRTPLLYSIRSFEDLKEIGAMQKSDRQLPPDIALASYFFKPKTYWENATTFVSVFAQKAVEEQDKDKIRQTIKVCELLLQRYETQKKLEVETQLPDKNYAYPSVHNLAQLMFIRADAMAQLKDLGEENYRQAIDMSLEAITLFQQLEKDEAQALYPSGADYFSIAKTLTTIGDLNVRIGQVRTREMDFEQADRYFREAEKFYAAVAGLDAGLRQGIQLNAEALPGIPIALDISVTSMQRSWESNLSKGYIRHSDRLRGFQGTFHFLKALAAIKIEGAFLENPTKKAEDYKMDSLINRLALLQNSFAELTHDPEQEVGFLLGLGKIIKANLLVMIGDRAQYDTSNMDRASALEYFNRVLSKTIQLLPPAEGKDAISRLEAEIIKEKAAMAARPAYMRPIIPDTIDDNPLIESPIFPFNKTAGSSMRFALIIAQLVKELGKEVYKLSYDPKGKKPVRFPYLFMLANLLEVDMAVRKYYITAIPFQQKQGEALLKNITAARQNMEKEEEWFSFQSKYLEASLLILRNRAEGVDLDRGIKILESALPDTEKFIQPSRVFYEAQICLLQGLAHVQRKKGDSFPRARLIVGKLEKMMRPDPERENLSEIDEVSRHIGWNLRDFKVRYSRLKIRSANMRGTGIGFIPF